MVLGLLKIMETFKVGMNAFYIMRCGSQGQNVV